MCLCDLDVSSGIRMLWDTWDNRNIRHLLLMAWYKLTKSFMTCQLLWLRTLIIANKHCQKYEMTHVINSLGKVSIKKCCGKQGLKDISSLEIPIVKYILIELHNARFPIYSKWRALILGHFFRVFYQVAV